MDRLIAFRRGRNDHRIHAAAARKGHRCHDGIGILVEVYSLGSEFPCQVELAGVVVQPEHPTAMGPEKLHRHQPD